MSEQPNPANVIEHARGVLAERFGVGIKLADEILASVARQQRQDVNELAAAIVASCTTNCAVLPRSLYEPEAAA
jgi:hypothetical protein